jgi:hypothetical protein
MSTEPSFFNMIEMDLAPSTANTGGASAAKRGPLTTPVAALDDSMQAEFDRVVAIVPQAAYYAHEKVGDDLGVSQASADLVAKEQALLGDLSPSLVGGETLYADGQAFFYDSYQKESAEAYAKLPPIEVVAEAHADTIARENRRGEIMNLREWYVDTAGRLSTYNGAGTMEINPTAWSRLTTEAPKDESIPMNVNAWIGHSDATKIGRIRDNERGAELFSLVSGKYVPHDSDRLVAEVAKAMPGTRAEIEYDRETTRIRLRAFIQAPCDIPAFNGVGRVHQIGIEVTSRDDGLAAAKAKGFLMRARCRNFSLSERNTSVRKVRHMGKGAALSLAQLVTQAAEGLPALIAEMQGLWARAATEYFTDSESGANLSPAEAIVRLVAGGYVPTCGVSTEDAIDAYTAAWRAEESPQSAAGVIMAIQRASHEGAWRTRWADDAIEAAAGSLLYQTVSWRLDAADDNA